MFNYLNEYSRKVIEKIALDEELTNTRAYDSRYEDPNLKKDRLFLVRAGTPISEIDPDELPSPRGEQGEREKLGRPKKIIPRRPYEDKNLREILDMLYRNRKFVTL